MILLNSAEGQASGTAVTTANSGGGSGDAFNGVTIGTGGALVFSAAQAAHGSQSYALTGATNGGVVMAWTGLSSTTVSVRMYFNTGSAIPTSAIRLIDVRNSTTSMSRIILNTTGKLSLQDYNGNNTKWTATNALSTNTWYRIEMVLSVSSNAATMKAAYYVLDSSTPVETPYSITNGNTGTVSISGVSLGSAQTATWTGTAYYDDLAVSTDAAGSYIGPYAASLVPGVPTGVSANPGDSQAYVTYVTPDANGGSAITGYTATASPGGQTGTVTGSAASPITVGGLTNGTSYTFTVHASNAVGSSAESTASNPMEPAAAPLAPTNVVATTSGSQTQVSFTPSVTSGGPDVSYYTVTSNPGNIIASDSTSPITITGLTNGTSYTFTVTATDINGTTSVPSSPSNSVTPTATVLKNTAEGQATGTTVSAANSGGDSGNAFDVVTVGSNATLTFSDAVAAHGAQSYKLTTAGSMTSTLLSWRNLNTSAISMRMYFNPGATLPGVDQRLVDVRNSTASMVRLNLNASGQLYLQNFTTTTIWTATTALSTNTWYRIDLALSASSSAATIKTAYYVLDNTSPVEAAYSTTTGNTGSTNVSLVNFGMLLAATMNTTAYYDDLTLNLGTTNYVGTSIVANAGIDQTVEPNSLVTLSGSGTGGVISYAWSQISGTVVTLNGVGAVTTYTAPVTSTGDTAVFRLTVTDSAGNTATKDVTITTLPARQFYLSNGTWKPLKITYIS